MLVSRNGFGFRPVFPLNSQFEHTGENGLELVESGSPHLRIETRDVG